MYSVMFTNIVSCIYLKQCVIYTSFIYDQINIQTKTFAYIFIKFDILRMFLRIQSDVQADFCAECHHISAQKKNYTSSCRSPIAHKIIKTFHPSAQKINYDVILGRPTILISAHKFFFAHEYFCG